MDPIKKLRLERAKHVDRMQAIQDLAAERGEDLTEAEAKSFESHDAEVKRLDKAIERALRLEELEVERAENRRDDDEPDDELEDDKRESRRVERTRKDGKDGKRSRVKIGDQYRAPGTLQIARAIISRHHKGNLEAMQSDARAVFRDPLLEKLCQYSDAQLNDSIDLTRAAVEIGDTATAGWAAELVAYRRSSSEFIELLRPRLIVDNVSGETRTLQFGMDRKIIVPGMGAGVSGGWVGEKKAIPVEALTTLEKEIVPFKAAALVVISNVRAQYSNPAALTIVRNDLLDGVARTIDAKFASNDAATATSPAGVFNGGGTFVPAGTTGNDALARTTLDHLSGIRDLNAANIPAGGRVWLMNTQEEDYLAHIRDSLGNFAWRAEVLSGRLGAARLLASNNIAVARPGLVAADQVYVAYGRGPMIDTSQEASIHMESAPDEDIGGGGTATPVISLFQSDAVGVRMIQEISWLRRYAAASTLSSTTVDWNPASPATA